MAKKTKKKKSEAKAALEEAVTAVTNKQPYNLESSGTHRDIGTPVYAKLRDLERLEANLTDQIEEDNRHMTKDLSRLEQAQTRVTDRLDHRSRLLRNTLVIVIGLVVILIGFMVWIAITLGGLSNQINQKQTATTNGVTLSVVEPSHDINLSEKDTDITLVEGGEYNLTGTTTHSINITVDDDVTLHLNNVNITSDAKTAINYTGDRQYALHLDLISNTKNTIISNGTDTQGGTLHSTGQIILEGEGSLDVYGAGTYGNGIKTSGAYFINGGKILNVGSDMIEKSAPSLQRSLSFDLSETVNSGSSVQVRNSQGTILKSFVAAQDFRTLVWSQPNLSDGAYNLFVNDKKIQTINL